MGTRQPILRRVARVVARTATRYATADRFELQRPTFESPKADVEPKDVYAIVHDGIESSFFRIPIYAGLARMLAGEDLGFVIEFGGSSPPLARLLKHASWNVAPNYPTVDLTDLRAYSDASCDTIVLDNILEHVRAPRRAVEECARVLRPGGRLVSAVPFLIPIHPTPMDFQRWTPDGYAELLSGCFENVRLEGWGNRETLKLMTDFGTPAGWPTFAEVRARVGDAHAWLLLQLNEPEWPIVLWAVARKAMATAAR